MKQTITIYICNVCGHEYGNSLLATLHATQTAHRLLESELTPNEYVDWLRRLKSQLLDQNSSQKISTNTLLDG